MKTAEGANEVQYVHCNSNLKHISLNTQVVIFVIWIAISATRNTLHCSLIFIISSYNQVLLYVYVSSSCQLALFGYPDWRFFRAFSSAVRQMPGCNSQRRGTARTLPKLFVLFFLLFVLCRSVYCLCVNVYCTTATGWLPNCSLTNISYHIWYRHGI